MADQSGTLHPPPDPAPRSPPRRAGARQAETGARVLYVLFPGEGGSWRVQCVPARADSFESRRPLPEPLRGLRDAALSERAGIGGGVFVHATGFIAGMSSLDGALALARMAMAGDAP
jgi:uncharacterized UPF0160 family protein